MTKTRIETESDVDDCGALAEIFLQLGYVPVFHYEKFRTEWASSDTPGFTRASVRCHVESGRVTDGLIIVGTKISVTIPGSVPVNEDLATPIISNRPSPTRNVRPTALGSPPNRRSQ